MSSLAAEILVNYRKQFAYYRHLGDGAMAQLTEPQLFRDEPAGTNSVAVIVKHLSGNMRSRWTDFLTTDGEKPWRNRDQEFVDDFADRMALLNAWDEGWSILEGALNTLEPQQLERVVYIRNEGHLVVEALNRQLAHYAYHVGQIVLIAKRLRGEAWRSLSVPRGESSSHNAKKFAEEKGRRNFIDDLLSPEE